MTDALVLDERKHVAAIKTVLEAALGNEPGTVPPVGRVYDYGTVPGADGNAGTLPNIFTLLGLERRYVEPDRAGRTSRSGWRLTVRYVGRTVDEARWAAAKVAAALETRLVVDGVTSTPLTHESTQAIALDEGRFSGWAAFTYVL